MRRVLRVVARLLRYTLGALAALVVLALGLILCLNVPIVRRTVVHEVNARVFAPLFRGSFVIESIGHLDAFGIGGASIRVSDPTGRPVLIASGIDGRIATLTLVRTLLSRTGDIVIDLGETTIAEADVRIDIDDAGVAIANAFLPRTSSRADSSGPPGRGVRLYAPHIHIRHAWGHGAMPNLPYLDGDVSSVSASFALEPDRIAIDIRRGHVAARGIALGADADGDFTGHLTIGLVGPATVGGNATWDGTAGKIREKVTGAIEGGRFDASVDVPEATSDAIRSLWPASPIEGLASAHVEAHGPLSDIAVDVHGGLDAATVDAHGTAVWADTKSAALHLDVAQVDLRALVTGSPASSLGAVGDVQLSLHEGQLEGAADVVVPRGRIGPHPIPRATVTARGFRAASGAFGGDAKLLIEEPGAPTTVILHAEPKGQTSVIDVSVTAREVDLRKLRRVPEAGAGKVNVVARGKVDLDDLLVDLDLDVAGGALSHGPFALGTATAKAHVRGALLNPFVDLHAHVERASWGSYRARAMDVSAKGRLSSAHVSVEERGETVPDVAGSAEIALLDGPLVQRVDLRVSKGAVTANVHVDRVKFRPGSASATGVVVRGLGEAISASVEVQPAYVRVAAVAPRIDVARVATLVPGADALHGGVVMVDGQVEVRGRRTSGRAKASALRLSIGDVEGISASLDGRLDDHSLEGSFQAQAAGIGTVALVVKRLDWGGVAGISGVALRRAWGDVDLTAHVDLAKVTEHLPKSMLPGVEVSGELDVVGRLERDSASDFTPRVDMQVTTRALYIRGKAAPAAPPPWSIQGVDIALAMRVNGDTGRLETTTHVRDAHGDLAVLDVSSSSIPYGTLYQAPNRALELAPTVPFDANLVLPRRPVSGWPAFLGRFPFDGALALGLVVHGPIVSPRATLSASIMSLSNAFTRLTSPLELSLEATYDGAAAVARLKAQQGSRDVLDADAQGSVRASDLVSLPLGKVPWKGSLEAHVDDFPLVTVGPLDDRGIRGRLSGDLVIADFHENARAELHLSATSLKIGDVSYPTATASLIADGATARGKLRLDQGDGSLAADISVPAAWGASEFPRPDPSKSLVLDAQAQHFHAATFLPFLRGSIDELDGFLDATVHASVDPTTSRVRVAGSAELAQGLFELSSFGGELHDVAGKVTVTPEGLLTVEKLTAKGVSGQVSASASARLDGLRLTAGSAVVQIPKSRPVPLSSNGSVLGNVDGTIDVRESLGADGRTVLVKVDVPSLHLSVPDVGSQDVQALGPMTGVELGVRGLDGEFLPMRVGPDEDAALSTSARTANAVPIQITTHLGDDVVVRRGTDVRIDLSGGPTVTITNDVKVSGKIILRGGTLNLYGKTFEIEQGSVTFVGADAGNPQVSVTAGWTASDGTQVKADFIGPLKTGKVTLRSEPSLPNNQIVQLLLFGSTDEQAAQAQGVPGTSSAEGVAGNIATQPLNRALSQFGLSAVSAKVDTSSVNARPEVEVQIAKDLSVAVAQVIGQVPIGTNPDTTYVTIDWRFLRKWSVAATVGNADSTIVDLLWRYRY